jgi:hypothetical protein
MGCKFRGSERGRDWTIAVGGILKLKRNHLILGQALPSRMDLIQGGNSSKARL